MKTYILLFFLPILTQCSTGPAKSAGPVPTLHNRALQKSWGKPKSEQTSDGFRVTYTNPSYSSNRLTILAKKSMWASHQYPPNVEGQKLVNGNFIPTSKPQVFRSATIMGKRIKYYQTHEGSGADAPRFRTVGVQLTNPSGAVGNYLIDHEGEEKEFSLRLAEMGW